jgi:hypothetical protein
VPGAALVGEVTERVDVEVPPADKLGLPGFRLVINPPAETETDRVTVPEKPSRLVRVMVDVLVEPAAAVIFAGLADDPKSWMVTVTCAERTSPLLEPKTVTL